VVLAWLREEGRFHEECLVIPSEELTSIAGRDVYGHPKFEFHTGSSTQGRVDAFRHPASKLPAVVANLLSG
jgi:hypothetical protein